MSKRKRSAPRSQRRKNKMSTNPSATSERKTSKPVLEKLIGVNKKSSEDIPANKKAGVTLSNLSVNVRGKLVANFVFGKEAPNIVNTIDQITTEHASRLEKNEISFYFNQFNTEDLAFLSPFDEEIAKDCMLNLYKLMMINKAPLPPQKSLLLDVCKLEQDDLIEKLKPQRSLDQVIALLEGYMAKLMPDTNLFVINYIKDIIQKKPTAIAFKIGDIILLDEYLNDDFDIDCQIRCINIFYTSYVLRSLPNSPSREILEYSLNTELQWLINQMNTYVGLD